MNGEIEVPEHVVAIIIGLAGIAVNLCVAMVGAAWALGRSNHRMMTQFDAKVEALERNMRGDIRTESKFSGDAIGALRQKVTEVEIWNRDNFVSKQTFNLVISEIKESWRRFEDKIDKKLEAIGDQLAGVLHRNKEI